MRHVRDLAIVVFLALIVVWMHYETPLIHDTLWNIRTATYNVSETSRALNENSAASLQLERKILGETSEFIKLTNVQLYGKSGHPGLIPQATTLVVKAQPVMDNLASATAKLNTAIYDLDGLINSGKVTIEGVTASEQQILKLIADIDTQVADPNVKAALAHLADAAQSGAEATKQLAAIATDGRQIADKARETYLKPVNLWWAVVKELLPLAGSAAQVVK